MEIAKGLNGDKVKTGGKFPTGVSLASGKILATRNPIVARASDGKSIPTLISLASSSDLHPFGGSYRMSPNIGKQGAI